MSFLKLSRKLKPTSQKPRHKCPFYGFHTSLSCNAILDQLGNQCGLETREFMPCPMEVRGETPDWNQCDLRNVSRKEKTIANLIREKFRVFAQEFYPIKGKSWKGISFKQWLDYVMGSKVKRPEPTK
jgi:hypothetical protein